MNDVHFSAVSLDTKLLYGLLLDRMALYIKNGWLDESGRVYIIFTIADVMESLSCAEQKANKRLNELDNVRGKGLIERKRCGLGNLTLCFYYVNLYVIKGKPVVRP